MPLLYAGIYAAGFDLLGVRRTAVGLPAFLVGVASWQWTAGVIGSGSSLFARNLSLVQRMPARWGHHAAAAVLCESAPLAAILPLAAALAVVRGGLPPPAALAAILFLAVAQAAALSGLTMLLASANVFLRDVERLSAPLTMVLFFVTPVAFAPEVFHPGMRAWLMLNPAAVFVEGWRAAWAGTLGTPLLAAAGLHAAGGLILLASAARFCGPRLARFL